MQLGFVSAILFDVGLEDVFAFAADEGFGCVELMCWPPGAADRRYAGVTHLDVTKFNDDQVGHVRDLSKRHGVAISGLGYYPNPLHADPNHRKFVIDHLKRVISAARRLDVNPVNTFIGRDSAKSVEQNWPMFQEVWNDVVTFAETEGVRVAIENCPMLFSQDEWPGGANLATSPAIWRSMFEEVPSLHFGLNIDPSHLIWLHIDYLRAIHEFGSRIFHVHAKDTRIDPDGIYNHGVMGLGWHTPKLPGLGDVDWGRFVSALCDVRYQGPVCIEVEDRAFEDSPGARRRALKQSKRYLEQFVS